MSATVIEYPSSSPHLKAYWERKERELKGIMAGPTSTVTLELPKPLADHLLSFAGDGKKVEEAVIRWLWSSYRSPIDIEEDRKRRERLGLDKIQWTPVPEVPVKQSPRRKHA